MDKATTRELLKFILESYVLRLSELVDGAE